MNKLRTHIKNRFVSDVTSLDNANNPSVTIIEPSKGIELLNWKELVCYRDLFRFLIWRQIKVRYAQSAIGIGWAIIQPLFSMLIFTIVFGRLAKVGSDGVPYALFSMAALLPWTYFSNAVGDGVSSLIGEANMLRKIYFPRILLPTSAVAAKLVDFGIASVMMAILMAVFGHAPPWQILFLPLAIALMILAASGISCLLYTSPSPRDRQKSRMPSSA